ncbi:hypothetical protein ACQZ6F_04585 [Rhizobium sp. A22-96]
MGLWDLFTGKKYPEKGVGRQPIAMLRTALISLNQDSVPFVVRDGSAEGVDLVAEWKIVDAQWYEFFAKAGIKRLFKVLMRFDEQKGEVRSVDQEWSVEWSAGVPTIALSASAFRGQTAEKSFGKSYGFREDGSFGVIYDYAFDTTAIKAPLQKTALEAGWIWRSVAFAKL